MNSRTALIMTTAALGTLGLASVASARLPQGAKPIYKVIKRLTPNVHTGQPASGLPEYTAPFTYGGKTYNPVFVGAAPTGGTTTTLPVYIIPIKMTYGSTSFSPLSTLPNGKTVIANIIASPLFQSSVDYVQNGTDLGKTQYEDAFQRATLWGTVKSHTGWHTILGTPTVEPLQSLTVPSRYGTVNNDSGSTTIEASINWFDPQIESMLTKLSIPVNSLPIFITTQTYLLEYNKTGCCIGGYHSVTSGGQTYSMSTYIQNAGEFAQDVSALSHEIGEWLDDPNTNNPVPSNCGSGAVLEVGDPLEGNSNYGGYPYTVGGFTYNLQDLTLLTYFGAPAGTSLATGQTNTTFQGEYLPFCSNGG